MFPWWFIDSSTNNVTLTLFFICNTLNLIGGILLLVAIYKAEMKCRKEKKKVDDK